MSDQIVDSMSAEEKVEILQRLNGYANNELKSLSQQLEEANAKLAELKEFEDRARQFALPLTHAVAAIIIETILNSQEVQEHLTENIASIIGQQLILDRSFIDSVFESLIDQISISAKLQVRR